MGEHWRAITLLVGTAWRVDPGRSLGLALEPIAFLRVPLFGWCLKLMTDATIQRDMNLLALGAAGISATAVLGFAGIWFGSQFRIRLIESVGFALNREIAMLTSTVPSLEPHERLDFQDRLELLRQGHGILGSSLDTLVSTAKIVVFGVGTLAALALTAPWLLLILPFALPALPITTSQQRWFSRAESRSAEPGRLARYLHGLTLERNAGMELRVFGLGPEILGRFERARLEAARFIIAAQRRGALLGTAGDILFLSGFAAVVALMLWRASSGQATAGDVVLALFLTGEVRAALVDPIRSVSNLGETLRAAGRILWLKQYTERAAAAASGRVPAPIRLTDGIVFDRVSFRYPGTDRWALKDLSMRIPAGAVVAFVGENGAGKTTVVKLLCRMYEPSEGRILVDGVNLADIDVRSWRTRLSAAFQDFARFEFIARHAVGVGDLPRLDHPAAVRSALERASASDVLAAVPHGVDAQLGARWQGGVDLSAGQWQKLALGRAFMREDPLLVFFDEPTASLDPIAEHALFENYAGAARAGSARGAITLLVSHRFSTVRSAHLIAVIAAGGLVERGSHQELMLRGGLYAQLYDLQARAYA